MKGKISHSEEQAIPSKSQRRRDALELKSLASDLIKLSSSKLARVPLDEDIRAAIMEARQIRSNVARKRQLQYAAKLLRRIDPEPILHALTEIDGEARQIAGRQHRAEIWRDFLIESGDHAVGILMELRNDADSQAIRQLVRNARKELSQGKAPASARALFRTLRAMDESEPLPPATDS